MADDKNKFGDDDQFGDSGLGNLPPLSDFDSQSGFGSDSDSLPPLSGFDTPGGLPPLSDIESETPLPRSPDQGRPVNFDSGPATIATPAPSFGRAPGKGFQDIAADSDFSPETPEIGPGPDSNVDTPMFDSAFGGGDQDFDISVNTPAPTQAMETPMFGQQGGFGGGFGGGGGGGGFGFDDNAFNAGTPAPDFSPDTEVRRPGGGAFAEPAAAAAGGKKKKGGGLGVLLAAVICLIIGVVAAPFVAEYLPFLPNPMVQKVQDLETQVKQKDAEIAKLRNIGTDNPLTPEQLQELTDKISAAKTELDTVSGQLTQTEASLTAKNEELALVEEDLKLKSEEYALAQTSYEDLQNEMAIVQARQKGLASEVERLTNLVGGLEDANIRRAATKDALAHDVDRLLIQVKESLPLTPEKYSHDARVAAIESLRDEVTNAKWVAPDLLEKYTSAYLKELEISQREEYFFAKMPVSDDFGNGTSKWAEALMLGNRAVYYRSLDGKSIGIYTNTGTADSPNWGVEEVFDKDLRAGIESRVFQARVPGFEQKVQFLAERELSEEEGSAFQRAFSSL